MSVSSFPLFLPMENVSCSHRQGFLKVLAVLILGIAYMYGQYIGAPHHARPMITVQGEAKVSAIPDIAVLSFGVQTGRRKTAQVAMERLNSQMDMVVAAVKGLGIEEKDISTQSLWLNPAYDYYDGRQVEAGFEANQNLSVKVRDLSKLSSVLDAVVSQGANQVGGVSFTIDDPEALREEGRAEAIADAQKKAANLATSLGERLGKLKGYSEGGYGGGMPYPMMEMSMNARGMGGGGGSVVPVGEQEMQVTVSLTYELQ